MTLNMMEMQEQRVKEMEEMKRELKENWSELKRGTDLWLKIEQDDMKVDNYDETVDEFKSEDFDSYRSTDSLNLEDKKKRLCVDEDADEDAEWKKS